MDDDDRRAAVHRGNQSLDADAVAERAGERQVDAGVREERGADDHLRGAERRGRPLRARRCGCRRPRGRAARRRSARTSAFVVAGALRRVEIDQLHLGKPAKPRDPRVDVGRLDRQPLALHELDDAAALEVDGRNQHCATPRSSLARRVAKVSLQVADGVLGVMKDRRGQRGVGAPVVNTSTKWSSVPAPPDAMTGIETAAETAAVISQSKPALVPSRSIDVSRISPAPRALRLARPFHGVAPGGRAARCARRRRSARRPASRRSRRPPPGCHSGRRAGSSASGFVSARAVQAHLVGARIDRRRRVGLGPDAAADGQRNEQLARRRRGSCRPARGAARSSR